MDHTTCLAFQVGQKTILTNDKKDPLTIRSSDSKNIGTNFSRIFQEFSKSIFSNLTIL